jgi:hypothetical protein
VVAARSMGIWERKKTTREKAGAAWERKEGVEAARTETEKNFGPDHSFTYSKNIVVQPKL